MVKGSVYGKHCLFASYNPPICSILLHEAAASSCVLWLSIRQGDGLRDWDV